MTPATLRGDQPEVQTSAFAGAAVREETVAGYVRSPVDVLRFVIFACVALVLVGLTRWATDTVVGFEADVIEALDGLTPQIERIVSGALQIFVLALVVTIIVIPLAARRYRVLGYLVTVWAITVALVVLFRWRLDRARPEILDFEIASREGFTQDIPGSGAIGALAGAFVVLSPFATRRYRRAGAISLALIVIGRLIVAVHLPVDVFAAIAIGAAVGAAVLYAFGRPDQHPTVAAIEAALRGSGVPLATITSASVDARGSVPYFGTLADGGGVFVKVLGAGERSADLLFRVYRSIRLKNLGDERPFSSLRRTVEHEALLSLFARDSGVRTPRLWAVAEVGTDSMLICYDRIDGHSLDRVGPADVHDPLLRDIWGQVAILRQHRIAHRDLRTANLFVDDHRQPWIIDFGFSELAAGEALLDADVAQLLAALSIPAGADRAVGSAIDVLGRDAVAAALPRLQPNALSGATRSALKRHPGLLKEVQQTVVDRCAIAAPRYEQLERVDGRKIFTLVMLAAVTYFLLPQLADLPGVFREISDANWAWLPAVIAVSAVTYVGATIGMIGSIPERLRPVPTFVTQVASSFASKLAPAGIGGMALNVRYLQRAGVNTAVATSGVGLNTVAGLAMHVVLLLVFGFWGGRQALDSLDLPDWHIFAYGVLAVVGFSAAALAVPAVRRVLLTKLVPVLRRSAGGLGQVARRPSKLALLCGGSLLVTIAYIVCLYLSSKAFGATLGFATLGAVYLAGAAVATAAPTPGGLGALEAAVIAGLVAAGVDKTVAVPTVFLYRLVTFWLPILPGWLGFKWLQREEFV